MVSVGVKLLDEVDRKLLALKLEKPGLSLASLAEEVHLNLQTVWLRVNKPNFKKVLADYQRHAIDIIKDARNDAARQLVKLIHAHDERVSAQVCLAILADALPGSKLSVNHSGAINLISSVPRPEISETEVAGDGKLLEPHAETETATPVEFKDILPEKKNGNGNGHNGNGTNGNGTH